MVNELTNVDIKKIIDWCQKNGHSDDEIMSLIRDLTDCPKQNSDKIRDLETIYDYEPELPTFTLYLDKDTGRYGLFFEGLMGFDSDMAAKGFLLQILKDFTKWMKDNNNKTKHSFNYLSIFEPSDVFNTQYDTVEDAYYAFKNLVIGCSIDISRFDLKGYYKKLIKAYRKKKTND